MVLRDLPSDQPQALQTRVTILADDGVIVHGDAERTGDWDGKASLCGIIPLPNARSCGGTMTHGEVFV
jgi:hypothetical protein